jgi:hypothetical protein
VLSDRKFRYLRRKLRVTECESEGVEVHRDSIKRCVLDTMGDLMWKVDRKYKKSLTQEITNKMDEQRKVCK